MQQSNLKKYLVNQGAFGKIFSFEYHGKTCAVKKVNPKVHTYGFELRSLRALPGHRNIVKYYGHKYNPKDCSAYFLFEFLQGMSLRQVIDCIPKDKISDKIIANWLMQCLLGLSHLKKHGIIHRDIKPDNIMITKEGIVKIIDFGFALHSYETYQLSVPGGTLNYMSPQTLSSGTIAGFQTDIWGLGVTFFQLLNRKLPFRVTKQQVQCVLEEKRRQNSGGKQNSQQQIHHVDQQSINYQIMKNKITNIQIQSQSSNLILNQMINRMLIVNPQQRITVQKLMNYKIIYQLNIQLAYNKNYKLQYQAGQIISKRIQQINHIKSLIPDKATCTAVQLNTSQLRGFISSDEQSQDQNRQEQLNVKNIKTGIQKEEKNDLKINGQISYIGKRCSGPNACSDKQQKNMMSHLDYLTKKQNKLKEQKQQNKKKDNSGMSEIWDSVKRAKKPLFTFELIFDRKILTNHSDR